MVFYTVIANVPWSLCIHIKESQSVVRFLFSLVWKRVILISYCGALKAWLHRLSSTYLNQSLNSSSNDEIAFVSKSSIWRCLIPPLILEIPLPYQTSVCRIYHHTSAYSMIVYSTKSKWTGVDLKRYLVYVGVRSQYKSFSVGWVSSGRDIYSDGRGCENYSWSQAQPTNSRTTHHIGIHTTC